MCVRHKHCAYSGLEPGLCPVCHASVAKCAGKHGGRPADGWGEVRRGARASATHKALREGQYIDPTFEAKARDGRPQRPAPPSFAVSTEEYTYA